MNHIINRDTAIALSRTAASRTRRDARRPSCDVAAPAASGTRRVASAPAARGRNWPVATSPTRARSPAGLPCRTVTAALTNQRGSAVRGTAPDHRSLLRSLRCVGRAWACAAVAPSPATWGGVASDAEFSRRAELSRMVAVCRKSSRSQGCLRTPRRHHAAAACTLRPPHCCIASGRRPAGRPPGATRRGRRCDATAVTASLYAGREW